MPLLCPKPQSKNHKDCIYWAPATTILVSYLLPLIPCLSPATLALRLSAPCSTIFIDIHVVYSHIILFLSKGHLIKKHSLITLCTILRPTSHQPLPFYPGLHFSVVPVTPKSQLYSFIYCPFQLDCKFSVGKDYALFTLLFSVIRVVLGQK